MKTKKLIAFFVSLTVVLGTVMFPAAVSADEQNDSTAAVLANDVYGTVTSNADGSVTLNFGQDSITTSGRGSIITDEKNGNVLRPDNLRTNNNDLAVLTMAEVSLKDSGYDSIEILAANKNSSNVSVRVGGTEVAVFSGVNTSDWDDYRTFTQSLTTTDAEGNVTLNISGVGADTYCGNFVYVRFYSSSGSVSSPQPSETEKPADPTPIPEADTPYTITGAEFSNDGSLSVTYLKNDEAPEEAVLLAAAYSDTGESQMLDFTQVDIDGSGAQSVEIDKPETGIVKVFIWDGVNSLQPLSNTRKLSVNISNGDPIYMDTNYSFEERAADLVSRMTLEEKVSQLGYKAPAIERLGVAEYDYWKEALHGVARQGKATSFPTALSLSNTWNRDLMYTVADIISTEARAKNNRYNLSYWSPTVNMARDPRWGRNEETYGEDPYLSSQLGAEFVKGMQGDDEKYLKTIATLKHFAANNNESGRSSGSSMMTEFNFRNYYTRVYQDITEIVMPASVMASYNATSITRNGEYIYNFIPSAANSYLLQDLLRRNWGFDGYVTSDCGAGEYAWGSNTREPNPAFQLGTLGSTELPTEQYVAAFYQNGLNLECNLSGGNISTAHGVAAVENGYLSEEELERVVYELFLQRFRTGEFDDGAAYQDITSSALETDENVAVAEKAAEESWVLLKNDDNMLPLDGEQTNNVAIVGNLANEIVLGDYTGEPTKTVTPVAGITEEVKSVNPGAEVNHYGVVTDDTLLFNVKSINFVYGNGSKEAVDLTKATNVSGMTLNSDGSLTDVTPSAYAVIEDVDFNGVVNIEVEMSTGSRIGGSINIGYGPTIGFATVSSQPTDSTDTYVTCRLPVDIEDTGGYDGVNDFVITATPAVKDFSVENFKTQLDAADVIIAYAGTVPKNSTGLGDSDAQEGKDRSNINLPASQSHVQALCDAYPDKTVVVMSTVGQMNVEPFKDKCKAILWTSYNGQTQGTALAKILLGEANPSGRLSTTWYQSADVAKMELYGSSDRTIDGIKGRYTDYNIQATGSNPGHTYQYYTNDPVYPFGYGLSYTSFEYSNPTVDKSSVDANGTVTFTVDVTNTGSAAGQEVVQLYVSHPGAGSGTTPAKQLKGFEKIELQPGEMQTVSIDLNVRDMYLFSETEQRDVVPAGTYTAYLAKNAGDEANTVSFEVSGTLASTLKTVKAIPDGVSVNGLIREDGTALEAVTKINSNLSAVMSDEVIADLSNADVKYESSNSNVASVDENGTVTSGIYEGVANITCTVTIDGVTMSDSYPVVNKLEIKPSLAEINNALAQLKAEYDRLSASKDAYSETNWNEIEKIYSNGVNGINNASTQSELNSILAEKINNMNSVVMDNLSDVYKISSVNSEYIKNGVIDYSENGIPMYDGANGTVTNSSPYSGIKLQAADENGDIIDSSKLVWQINKFDSSSRKVAEIDSETGELTVYGNGIIQITAANLEDRSCGKLMVQVNMQIEGEYADNGNGADLTDSQGNCSGGNDAGSTADVWIEYKSVKLSNLESIVARYAGKNAGQIYVSLANNSNPENLIASGNATATGAWGTWSDIELTLNAENLYNAQINGLLDEYGCADIYIQTNGTNLDYFRLNYIENNDEIPYTINSVLNKTNGRMKVTLGYRGSVLATDVNLTASIDGKEPASTTVRGTGEFEISTGAAEGETVRLLVTDAAGNSLSEVYNQVWHEPVDSEIVVYTLNSTEYDYTVLSGGTDNTQYADTVNGLSGYGSWTAVDRSADYTYSDVNEKTYDYTFTKAWQAGGGSTTNRCLYFTPKSPCKVTAVFNGGEPMRSMTIYQSDDNMITQPGTGSLKDFSLEITDTSMPVYVYGGSSNKQLYAIIVEYYGDQASVSSDESAAAGSDNDAEDFDRPVQTADWNGTQITLTKNDLTGETKVWYTNILGTRTQLSTEYFAVSDVEYSYDDKYNINSIAAEGEYLYAGCDNGLVIIFTDCVKCYSLKKLADFDIEQVEVYDNTLYMYGGGNEASVSLTDLGADTIEADEARMMAEAGAILVDVRTHEEFEAQTAEGAINIPLENISELSNYSSDTTFVFFCTKGVKSAQAVKEAKAMGFENVYTAGSIDNLI